MRRITETKHDPLKMAQGDPPKRELRSRLCKDNADNSSQSLNGRPERRETRSSHRREDKDKSDLERTGGTNEQGKTRSTRQSMRTAIERSKRDRNGSGSGPMAGSADKPQPNKRVCIESGLRIEFPVMDPAMEMIKKEFLIEEAKMAKGAARKDHLAIKPPEGRSREHFYVNAAGTMVLRHVTDPPYAPPEPPAKKKSAKTSGAEKGCKTKDRKVNIPAAGVPLDNTHRPRNLDASKLEKVKAHAIQDARKSYGNSEFLRGLDVYDETEFHAKTEAVGDAESSVRLKFDSGTQWFRDFMEKELPKMGASTALSGDPWRTLADTPTLSFGPIPSFMKRDTKLKLEQEEAFHARPSIKIIMPDLLKGLLVDDWENITRNNQLIPMPHPHPVNQVLQDYLNYEKPQRTEGSASIDILDETIAGLKEYFDKCLGRILLYR